MLIVAVIRSDRLSLLQEAIAERNKVSPTEWGIFELERFDIAGIAVSRIALLCDELPPEDKAIAIEAIIQDRYCPECFKSGKFNRLPGQNKSGWCWEHQDKNPERTIRKRKKV
jgi:hypothetical protein